MNTGDYTDDISHAAADTAIKVQALRDMIMNAERTIQGAKAMLLQIEGKKKTGRPRKIEAGADEGTVVQGTFDGQSMQGADGKQYPVPANYASKSKLVEGDMLKLTITRDGSFIYKQIGPVERRHVIGIVTQDEHGNFVIVADGRGYRVLLASVTYFKLEPGDEVAILLPRDLQASFAAIEHVLQKGALVPEETLDAARNATSAGTARMDTWKQELGHQTEPERTETVPETPTTQVPVNANESSDTGGILEEWIREMEALEKEIAAEENRTVDQANQNMPASGQ